MVTHLPQHEYNRHLVRFMLNAAYGRDSTTTYATLAATKILEDPSEHTEYRVKWARKQVQDENAWKTMLQSVQEVWDIVREVAIGGAASLAHFFEGGGVTDCTAHYQNGSECKVAMWSSCPTDYESSFLPPAFKLCTHRPRHNDGRPDNDDDIL